MEEVERWKAAPQSDRGSSAHLSSLGQLRLMAMKMTDSADLPDIPGSLNKVEGES